MKSTMKRILVASLAAVTLAGSLVPAQAMPLNAPKAVTVGQSADVVDVQYYGDRYRDRGWRRGPPPPRYYGGHRRHRDRDVLLPLGALAAGAIIGGALSQPREVYRPVPEYRPRPVYQGRVSQAHVDWCANRYRSYDYRSNTFQPYNGPRQTCYSPYS